MNNPYAPPESVSKRVFKTPIITPLSILLMLLIYAGYAFLHHQSGQGLLPVVEAIAFETFVICEIGMLFVLIYNGRLIKNFLSRHQSINNDAALSGLKAIARSNMYSSLFGIAFMLLGALGGIMTILNYGIGLSLIVGVLSIVVFLVTRWYNPIEKQVKQIPSSSELEAKVNMVLKCWVEKVVPNF